MSSEDKVENVEPQVSDNTQRTAIARFDLRDMFPASTIRIQTESSTYWVTRTHRLRAVRRKDKPTLVRGVSVHTTSKHNRWVSSKGPDDTFVGTLVRVGEPFLLGNEGHKTGKVTAITMSHS